MFSRLPHSKKVWLSSFVLITSISVVAAVVTTGFTDDFSSNTSLDTSKLTANLSTEEKALYLAWANQQMHGLPDGTTAGSGIGSETDSTYDIALGDVDRDGDLDLVVGNSGQTNKLYLNDGSGGFSTGTAIGSDTDGTRSITLGDIDSDGDLDVVVGNDGQNKFYLNNGSGGFTTGTGTAIGSDIHGTQSIALGDIDNDGDLDVVVGNDGETNKLYLNDGTGFDSTTAGTAIGSDTDDTRSITLGDIDNDGDLDVVAGNDGQTNKLYLNDGSGGFPDSTTAGTAIGSDTDKTYAIAFADVDNDGDFDLLAGNYIQYNKLYLNDGSGSFSSTGTVIGSDENGTRYVTFVDVDNDGDLDLVVGNFGQTNKLYLNDGSGVFPDSTTAGTDIGSGTDNTFEIALADVDNDGDLDIVEGNDYQTNKLYLNTSSGIFPDSTTAGTAIGSETDSTRAIALGDVDGDGDLDLVVGNNGQANKLYLNDGSGGFPTAGTIIGSETDSTQYIALADVDNDGDLDLVIGNDFQTSKLYLNDGSGGFSDNATAGIVIGRDTDRTYAIALGDLDNDGDLDLVAGNYGQINKLYLNDGSGGFPDSATAGTDIGSDTDNTFEIAFADVDNDGDFDLVVGNANQANKLYLNDGSGGFPGSTTAGTAIGSETDSTRAIALGDVDGDGDLDLVAGSNGQNKLYLNDGTGFDSATAGTDIGSDTNNTFEIALVDVDNDGDLDLVAGSNGQNKLYLNDGSGGFPDSSTAGTVIGSDTDDTFAIALGDLDNDGDLDLVVGNNVQTNKLYLNGGSKAFADPTTKGIDIGSETDTTRSIAIGDVDSDGDLDLVVGNFGQTNKLYLNDGSSDFPDSTTVAISIGSETDNTEAVALADVDNDGDLDLVVGNDEQANKLYLNDGSGEFSTGTDIGSETDGTFDIAIGDVDGDGDLDLVMGNDFSTGQSNKLYLNDGSGGFPDSTTAGVVIGSDENRTKAVVLADVDNDGDLDLVAGNDSRTNKLYLNNGSGVFPDSTTAGIVIGSDAAQTFDIALVDVNGDGYLDLVVGNLFDENELYLNDGSGGFPDNSTAGTIIGSESDFTVEIVLVDVDSDGDLDLVAGNLRQTNKYYLNDGSGGFPDSTTAGINIGSDTSDTQAIALADVDNNGKLDLITGNSSQTNKLYKQRDFYNTAGNNVYSNKVNGSVVNIVDVTLTATETTNTATTRNTSIDYYVTNNGGDKWYSVKSGTTFTFPETGTDDIRWRAQLNSLSPAISPVLSNIDISYTAFPKIINSTYDILNGKLTVSGTSFISKTGADNDIDASMFTFTGEANGTYTLTDTADVEITSATAFTLTLSATDKAAVNALVNKNGTTSTDATVYNLAAAEDWNAGAKSSLVIADTTTAITANNIDGSETTASITDLTVSGVVTSLSNSSYEMSYVITLTNSGNTNSGVVQVTTTIPDGVELNEVPANCELTGNGLTCTINNVEAGETITISLSLTGSENVNGAIVTSIVGADASSQAGNVSTRFDSVFKEVSIEAKSRGGSMPIIGLFACLILLLVRKAKVTVKTNTIKKLTVYFLVLFATGSQAAETTAESSKIKSSQSTNFELEGWSVDLSLGNATSEVSNQSAEQGLANNSQVQSGISTDGSRFAYQFELGYQVYPDWRVLAGYMDLGEATLNFNGVTSSITDVVDVLSNLDMVSGKGLTASLEYNYQYTGANEYNLQDWYLAPQIGLFSWQSEIGVDAGADTYTFKESDISLLYGLIIGYQFNEKVTLGLKWQQTKIERDVNTVLLTFSYRI